jgi:hypothetical protein
MRYYIYYIIGLILICLAVVNGYWILVKNLLKFLM